MYGGSDCTYELTPRTSILICDIGHWRVGCVAASVGHDMMYISVSGSPGYGMRSRSIVVEGCSAGTLMRGKLRNSDSEATKGSTIKPQLKES
jgi:hypothetical protein